MGRSQATCRKQDMSIHELWVFQQSLPARSKKQSTLYHPDAEAEVSGEGVVHLATKIESTLPTSLSSSAGLDVVEAFVDFGAFAWASPLFVYVCVMTQCWVRMAAPHAYPERQRSNINFVPCYLNRQQLMLH